MLLAAGVLVATPMGGKAARLPGVVADVLAGQPVGDSSTAQRLFMWKSALAHLTPWGHGLGSVPTQFPADQLAVPRYPSWGVPQLHNSYLHVLYEAGWVTSLILLMVLGVLIWTAWRILKQADPGQRPLAVAASLGLLGYSVTLLGDFHWYLWGLSVPALAMVALLLASGREPEAARLPAWAPALAAVGVAGLFLLRWIPTDGASLMAYQGSEAWSRGDRQEAAAAFRRATRWAPDYLVGHLYLGMTTEEWGEARRELAWVNQRSHLFPALLKAGWVAARLGDRDEARRLFERAHRINAYSASPLWCWGVALRDEERLAEAMASAPVLMDAAYWQQERGLFERALGRTEARVRSWVNRWPQHPEVHYRLGRVLEKQGRLTEARRSYEKALSLMGPVAADENGEPVDRLSVLDRRLEFRLGQLAYMEGNEPGAETWWSRSLSHGGPNPPAMWGLALLQNKDAAGILAANHLGRFVNGRITSQEAMDLSRFTFELPLDKRENWAMQSFRVPANPSLFSQQVTVTGWAGFISDEAKAFFYLDPVFPEKVGRQP